MQRRRSNPNAYAGAPAEPKLRLWPIFLTAVVSAVGMAAALKGIDMVKGMKEKKKELASGESELDAAKDRLLYGQMAQPVVAAAAPSTLILQEPKHQTQVILTGDQFERLFSARNPARNPLH